MRRRDTDGCTAVGEHSVTASAAAVHEEQGNVRECGGKGKEAEGMGQATAPSGGEHTPPILSPILNNRTAEAGRDL